MQGTLIPVIVGGMRTLKDGSISITLETQELSGGKAGEILDLRNKVAFVYISARQIDLPEQKMIDSLEPELKGKSPSLRMRNVLYRCWEQSPEGYKDSNAYYLAKMESMINGLKAELNP